MNLLEEENGQFLYHPFAQYTANVRFQKSTVPHGRMETSNTGAAKSKKCTLWK